LPWLSFLQSLHTILTVSSIVLVMTDDVVWAEPSEAALFVGSGAKPGRYVPTAVACKNNPGRWAKLPGKWQSRGSALSTANNIRAGKVQGFLKGAYEVAVDGTDVFVRYMAPEGATVHPLPVPAHSVDPERIPSTDVRPAEGPRRQPVVSEVEASQIRAWGIRQGMDLPERGRLPRAVIEAYWAANPPSESTATGTVSE
jgi:hypothetical protein